MSCWLCRFNHTTEAKTYHTFVIENLGRMSLDQMALDISEKIPDSREQITQHFQSHTLHPSLKITAMLRELLTLSTSMKDSLQDEQGRLDPRAVDAYLKLQMQILTIYKLGETKKLMFA